MKPGSNAHIVSLVGFLSLFALGCGGGSGTGPATTGALSISITTEGASPDPDGYAIAVDGGEGQDVGPNAAVTIDGLSEGTHEVAVQKTAANCSGPGSVTASVSAGETRQLSLVVDCRASIQDRIVFWSNRGGSGTVYTMNPDGSDPQELVGQSIIPWDVSGDGTRILGFTDTGSSFSAAEIVMIDATGSVTELTSNNQFDAWPQFEPGESTIVFTHNDSTDALYRIDADGSNLREIVDLPDLMLMADASPVSGDLVFSMRDASVDIFGSDADGSNITKLYSENTLLIFPTYSPSGDHIAFESRTTGADDLMVMNADGTGVRTVLTGEVGVPRWTAPGNALLYMRDGDIYRIDLDGTGRVNLTAHSASDRFAVASTGWSSGND